MYRPSESVTSARTVPVSTFRIVTVAPGNAAPVSSATWPEMDAVTSWAAALPARASRHTPNRTNKRLCSIVPPASELEWCLDKRRRRRVKVAETLAQYSYLGNPKNYAR